MNAKLTSQLRQHSVAIISLVVALSALAYNTWRNEETEFNRNVRSAGFEILIKLGELERVVFFSHYDKDDVRGNPRAGWAYVLTIRDMGQLSLDGVKHQAEQLVVVWQNNWDGLGSDEAALTAISKQVDALRAIVLQDLAALE